MAEPVSRGSWLTLIFPIRLSQWLGTAVLAVAYWLTAVVSLHWAVIPGAGTAFWPPAGLTIFALCRFGPQLWLGAALGRLATFWTVASGQPLAVQVVIAIGTSLGSLLPVLLQRPLRIDCRLQSLRSALWLVAAAIGGATLSAAVGGLALWSGGTASARIVPAIVNWWFGYATGVLTFAPLLLSLPALRRLRPEQWAHLAAACGVTALLAYVIFLRPDLEPKRAWFMFPALVWGALAFNAPGAALVCLITSGFAFAAAVFGVGAFTQFAPSGSMLLTQQFVAVMSGTTLLLAAVADERRGREALAASEARLRAETEALAVLNRTGAAIAAELDLDRAVQVVTDAGVAVTGAEFGAFFHHVDDPASGGAYELKALSGAPPGAFSQLADPRVAAVLASAFETLGTVRSHDITQDPRNGLLAPRLRTSDGRATVRSYLAAPVRSRSGEILGGAIFGHSAAGVFGERAEWLAEGVAAHAAIALDNARLYRSAQRELAHRRRAEEHQALLINELNHRVKNTLATVQSLGVQTLRSYGDAAEARHAFEGRLIALSAAHNLLTASSWDSADLAEVARQAVAPFGPERVVAQGPDVRLAPSQALALAMAFHELGTNAIKYGALSAAEGRVDLAWREEAGRVELRWTESGGPEVRASDRKGFGSRLIKEGLARELDGEVRLVFEPRGVWCEIRFGLAAAAASVGPLLARAE
jgi:two-component sensor histidine kinase/integral membrane sensor domain MASE1